MERLRQPITVLFIIGTLLLGSWPSAAGPLLPPQGPKVNDEILSLVGLSGAGLHIHVQQSPTAAKIVLPAEVLEKHVKQIFERGGLTIDDDGQDVRIVIHVSFHANIDHAELMSYVVHLALEQRLELPRLARSMMVPTYTLLDGSFCATQELEERVSRTLDVVAYGFLKHHDLANSSEK